MPSDRTNRIRNLGERWFLVVCVERKQLAVVNGGTKSIIFGLESQQMRLQVGYSLL